MNTNRYIKRKMPVEIFIILGVILVILAYLAGAVIKYSEATGAGFFDISSSLKYVIFHPFRNWFCEKTVYCFLTALMLFMVLSGWIATKYKDYHPDMEKGNAEWLDIEKAVKEMADDDDKYNRLLSSNLKISLRNNCVPNNNMLIIGSSGTMKTITVVEQNILQCCSNYVMLDVKGSTQEKISHYMINNGYAVNSLNTKEPSKSDRYNPFLYISNDHELSETCEALFNAAYALANDKGDSAASNDPFWPQGCKMYLMSLFYYEFLEIPFEERTLNHILDYTNMENIVKGKDKATGKTVTEFSAKINELEKAHGENYPPVIYYRNLQRGADKTIQSILIMVNAMLSPLNLPEVKRIFSGNDINMYDLAYGIDRDPEKKTVLFLVVPDNDHTFDFIVSMFYTQLFNTLIKIADTECGGPLPVPVEVWMDEFYAGAKPAEPLQKFGLVRSRNISMIAILQSVDQLKDLYGDSKWGIIADNTAVVVFLGSGPGAKSTHEWMSEILGETTIDTKSTNISHGHSGSSSQGEQKGNMRLMTPDQVSKMPLTDCIVLMQSRSPAYDKKSLPFDYKLSHDKNAKIIPGDEWLKERYSKVLSFGKYTHPVRVERLDNGEYVTVTEGEEDIPFKELTDEEIIRLEELVSDPSSPVKKMELASGDIMYYFDEAIELTAAEIQRRAQIALKKTNQETERISALMYAAGADKNDIEDALSEILYDVSSHSDWTAEDDFRLTLAKYIDEMSRQEQEIISEYISRDVSDDQINQFILLSFADKCRILNSEMERSN